VTAMCSPGGRPTARPRLRDKAVQEDSPASRHASPVDLPRFAALFRKLGACRWCRYRRGVQVARPREHFNHQRCVRALVGTVASLAPPLGMDAAQPFHRCRSSSTVCWESTPRIAFLSPEPGSRKSRALEVDHETRSGRRQVPLSALAQPETKVRKI
jgi:hypothetical protein